MHPCVFRKKILEGISCCKTALALSNPSLQLMGALVQVS